MEGQTECTKLTKIQKIITMNIAKATRTKYGNHNNEILKKKKTQIDDNSGDKSGRNMLEM